MPFRKTPDENPATGTGRLFPSALDLEFKVRGRRAGSDAVDDADAMFPRRARLLCKAWLRLANQEDLVDSLELVASELVTNALRYGCGPIITFRLGVESDFLRLAVGDGSSELPRVGTADPSSERGRGMRIVLQTVHSTGGNLGFSQDGTTTWCTFPISKERQSV
ncbi:ATP-binding protein [Streptomyces virginiae]